MSLSRSCFIGFVLLVACLSGATCLLALEAKDVLVVYNSGFEGSKELAEYYRDARGIPEANLLSITASTREEITRKDFDETIRTPVFEYLGTTNNAIAAICLIHGVPLKVAGSGAKEDEDFASVDSELSLIRFKDVPLKKSVNNPFYDKDEALKPESNVIAVTRIDGPSPEIARGLIDKAMLAEALGIGGESFLDTLGLYTDEGYGPRDKQMRGVADVWKKATLPFAHEDSASNVDLTSRPETLHYYGWYTASAAFFGKGKLRTGSIAVHLHSFSAATIRSTNKNWVGPLLGLGATATYGTVYEPYATGFPYEWIFWDRILKGYSFAEAGLMAKQLGSWQETFVGDPLYTPYPKDAEAGRTKRRAQLLTKLKGGEVEVEGDPYFAHCLRIIEAQLAPVAKAAKDDPAKALSAFVALSFTLKGMGLSEALAFRCESISDVLEDRWKDITKALKKDSDDTADLQEAVDTWVGFKVHEKAVKEADKISKKQDKVIDKALKNAAKDEKKERYLEAWQELAATRNLRLGSKVQERNLALTRLETDSTIGPALKREADMALSAVFNDAKTSAESRKFDESIEKLNKAIDTYPNCEQRSKCIALLAEVERVKKEQGG